MLTISNNLVAYFVRNPLNSFEQTDQIYKVL